MDQKSFQSLLKYYLSCMDAEEAAQLNLRRDQEYKTHIFAGKEEKERLFSKDLPQLEIPLTNAEERKFIERKAADAETLVDLHYGFPVFRDKKDMLAPLFFVEVEARFSDAHNLRLLPKMNSFSVNRMHFFQSDDVEETQRICDELEGEFGSFDARMKAAVAHIPSLEEAKENWIETPVLFRTNMNSSRPHLRYELTYLLKNQNALSEDTALKFFVQGKQGVTERKQASIRPPSILEIGTLNAQQEEAVIRGLQEPLSVITGPPGTGKTQVVTAILASAVFHNQTVLFASNNNMPVDGVYERLGQSIKDPGNWVMRLGNLEKRESCRKTIFSLLERLKTSNVRGFGMDQEIGDFMDIERSLEQLHAGLQKALLLEEKIRKISCKEEVIAQKLPQFWVQQFIDADPETIDAPLVEKFQRHSAPGVFLWLRRKLFGVEAFRTKHNSQLKGLAATDKNITECENRLLIDEPWNDAISKARETANIFAMHQNWVSCISQRRRLEAQVAQNPSSTDLFEMKKKKSAISRTLFNKYWLNDICASFQEAIEALSNYFRDIEDYDAGRHKRLEKSLTALKRFFPVWITTNQSAGAIMPPHAALFDLVVVDEAGQCDIPAVLPLLYRAKRAVIIGDPHQFKHITSLKSDLEHAIAQKTGLSDIMDEWSFIRRSAFDRAFSSTQCTSFLKQHYRCHPDIIEFSNHNFYEGKLVAQAPLSQFQNRLPIKESGLIWHHIPGQALKAQKGAWNPAEVNKTAEIFDRWAQQGLFSAPNIKAQNITYGVVTPFRKQAEEMRKALSKFAWFRENEDRFTIGTAHSFQGNECDILIYSPVVAEDMDKHLVKFAATQRDLINVTVTRAKNLLYIVGDIHECQSASPDTPLHQLAAYAEKLRKQQRYPLNAAEKAMAGILDELKLSYAPQHSLGQYRLDFIVNAPSGDRYNLEVDGDVHLTAMAVQHDERRDAYVMNQGFKILRFTARDIFYKQDIIKERLMRI